jgi:arabinofuranosyltransferase
VAPPDSHRTIRILGLAFFATLLVRTAWLSDDAYLTLRSVEHAASGFGLRWNVADRVQVYDHPLWLLVLLAGRVLSGETYFTALGLSLVASLTAVGIVLRRATTDLATVVAIAAATLSPVFLTFSTSGLESPLVHALAAAFIAAALAGRSATTLAAIAGLLILTHWTTLFLVAPVLAPRLLTSIRQTRQVLVLSGLPSIVWLLGAWWYYGTIGSNLHVASRSADVAWNDRLGAGWSFFLETTRFDPLFVAVLLMGVWLGVVMRGTPARLALGSALAIGWVVLSGGSEMAGRHLTASFLTGVILMVRYLSASGAWTGAVAVAAVLAFTVMSPVSTLTAGPDYGQSFASTARTHDARAEHYQATGLLRESRPRRAPSHPAIERARSSMVAGAALGVDRVPGMVGFAAGPEVYVLDSQGRTDPLLARLPPAVGAHWRWGVDRRIPEGYLEGLPDGAPAEPALGRLVEHIRDVTRGSLVSADRLAVLFRLPRRVRSAIASSSYGTLDISLDAIATGPEVSVPEGGVVVRLPAARRVATLTLGLTDSYDYRVEVLDGSTVVAIVDSPRVRWSAQADTVRHLTLASTAAGTALRIRCGRGVGRCAVGQVTIGQ